MTLDQYAETLFRRGALFMVGGAFALVVCFGLCLLRLLPPIALVAVPLLPVSVGMAAISLAHSIGAFGPDFRNDKQPVCNNLRDALRIMWG